MPPLEAMRTGCPVICARQASLPEIVGDAAILVDSDQPEDWARAFLEELPPRHSDLIEKGFQQAQRFRWEDKRAEWLNLLHIYGFPIEAQNHARRTHLQRSMRPHIMLSVS